MSCGTRLSASFGRSPIVNFAFIHIILWDIQSWKPWRWLNSTDAVIGLGYIGTTLNIRVLFLFLFNSLSLPSASREPLFQCLLLENPVVLEIEIEVLSHEELSEHGYQVLIVRLFVELELPTVVHQVGELLGVPLTQILNAGNGLLDLYLFILFLLGLGWKPLPREASADKVHKHYADLLKVIPSGLLDAKVSVQTRIPSCSCQRLVIFERDVTSGFWIFVALGQPKVDHVQDVLILPTANEEVVRLDVPVQEAVLMYEFDALQLLT